MTTAFAEASSEATNCSGRTFAFAAPAMTAEPHWLNAMTTFAFVFFG
jgi:hypothetical protein